MTSSRLAEAVPRPQGWAADARAAYAAWAASRLLAVGVMALVLDRLGASLRTDLLLFWEAAHRADARPVTEYPGLARAVLVGSAEVFDSQPTFLMAWIVAMLAVDVIILAILRRESAQAGWLWIVGGAALGPVAWLRFDMLLAVVVLLAVVLRERRPVVSGGLLAAAVLLKVWPVVLAAAVLPGHHWRRWLAAAGVTGVIGVLADGLASGWAVVIEPLTYQAGRGIQIESLLATPYLWTSVGSTPESVWDFNFGAYHLADVNPSWADPLGLLAVVMVCGVAFAALVRDPHASAAERYPSVAAITVVVIASNAVFSPQYVVWLIPVMALSLPHLRHVRGAFWLTVAIAGLTQLVWPWLYGPLLDLELPGLLVLSVRNALVLILAVMLVAELVRTLLRRRVEPVAASIR